MTIPPLLVGILSRVFQPSGGGSNFALTATPSGGGTITGGGTYPAGQVVTLTAVPNVGNVFTGWGGACSGIGVCQVTMNSNQSVTATFAVATEVLTTITAGAGSGSVSGGGTYNYGDIATLTATPATGSTFTGWSGAVTGTTNPTTVTMTANRSVTATFGLGNFTLSTSVSGSGTVSGAGSYAPGTVVPVTATPGQGATFVSWGGACSGSGACSVTMSADQSVVANFTTPTQPAVGWGTIPDISFTQGIASSFALSSYETLSTSVVTIESGSETGISLTGSPGTYALTYNGTSPIAGPGPFQLRATDPAVVPTAAADLFAINDSLADGATADYSHPFAKLVWKSSTVTYPQSLYQYTYQFVSTGSGDCIGSDGALPSTSNFFATATQAVTGANASLPITVTSLVNYWIGGHTNWGITLIGSAGAISNFSDRSDATVGNRPTLSITRSDGTIVNVPCSANRSLTTISGQTAAIIDCTAGSGSLLLYFDLTQVTGLTAPVQLATLSLFGLTRGGSNTIKVYATDMSYLLRVQSPVLGLAQGGVKDAALVASFNADLALAAGGSPPSRPAGGVIYAETWPDIVNMDTRGYYSRSSSVSVVAANMSLITTADAANPGYAPLATGVNSLKVQMTQGSAVALNMIWPFNGVWGYTPTHIWVRFYVMLANDWPFYDTAVGASLSQGKFPFAPSCHTPNGKGSSLLGKKTINAPAVSWSITTSNVIPDGGNGGTPATGACMWSMRNYWVVVGSNSGGVPTLPIHGPLAVAGYWPITSEDCYTADQWGPFGDDNSWVGQRTIAGLMKKNTWHAIELHVKMNTLHTAAGAGPNPLYLGNVRRMPYRNATDPLLNDQLGHDTSIETFTDHILFGNFTGERYSTGQAAVAPDTAVINSATAYSTSSMIGNRDGIYEVYVDGVLAHSRNDMRWRHIPDANIDCLWFDYGQTQLVAGSTGSVYFSQCVAVDGDIVTGPIGPMRFS